MTRRGSATGYSRGSCSRQICIFAFERDRKERKDTRRSPARGIFNAPRILRERRWRRRWRLFSHISRIREESIVARASDGAQSPPAAWLHFERKAQSLREIKFPTARATGCIAVGGLAIELRLDRCTSYIRYMKLHPPSGPLDRLALLPQRTNNAATFDRVLARGALKVASALDVRATKG